MLLWYAIRTRRREKDRADENLRAAGVEAFAPHVRKQRFNQFDGEAHDLLAAFAVVEQDFVRKTDRPLVYAPRP